MKHYQETGGFIDLPYRGHVLVIEKISGEGGFCGPRALVRGCCEVEKLVSFESAVIQMHFELLFNRIRDLQAEYRHDSVKCLNYVQELLKARLSTTPGKHRWTSTFDLEALVKCEAFPFKIQLISFVQDKRNGEVWLYA